MSARLRFDYELDDAGWALATISLGRKSVPMIVSYLHDSLRQLAFAIASLEKKEREATVVFMEEPGEHHLCFKKVAADKVALEVLWYADWQSWGMYDGPGQSKLRVTLPFAELRAQVVSAMAALLERHGTAGYRKRWIEHPFPLAIYRRLAGTTSGRRRRSR
jgi:hypothetical protein